MSSLNLRNITTSGLRWDRLMVCPLLQRQGQARDDEDHFVGGLRQALIGETLQIPERASDRTFRRESAANFVADDDDFAPAFGAPPRGENQILDPRENQFLLRGRRLLSVFPHQVGYPKRDAVDQQGRLDRRFADYARQIERLFDSPPIRRAIFAMAGDALAHFVIE